MAVTQIDTDEEAFDRAMALSGARTKKNLVNLAPRYYAERQERSLQLNRRNRRPHPRGQPGAS